MEREPSAIAMRLPKTPSSSRENRIIEFAVGNRRCLMDSVVSELMPSPKWLPTANAIKYGKCGDDEFVVGSSI